MNLRQRSYQKELLDNELLSFADVQQNMQELDVINTWLGGHRITLKGFNQVRGAQTKIHVCEIGCGGGDNLLAIYRWCKRHRVEVTFTGIDIKEECIAFAKTKKSLPLCVNWMVSDYRQVQFADKPDIIFSSLFCHHFTDEQLVAQLQWMQQHAKVGFFINDLHRHPLAYYSIQLITRFFSHSHLVKNDAPLSVARGFSREDWQQLFGQAGISSFQIQWQWAFRHLIVYRHVQH